MMVKKKILHKFEQNLLILYKQYLEDRVLKYVKGVKAIFYCMMLSVLTVSCIVSSKITNCDKLLTFSRFWELGTVHMGSTSSELFAFDMWYANPLINDCVFNNDLIWFVWRSSCVKGKIQMQSFEKYIRTKTSHWNLSF